MARTTGKKYKNKGQGARYLKKIKKANNNSAKPKRIRYKKKHAKKSNNVLGELSNTKLFLLLALLVMITFTIRYMYDSTNAAILAYDAADRDANSLLAYDKDQIRIAHIVGSRQQLMREIKGIQSASEDLQTYVINDYKLFKKGCVVNGALISPTSYELVSVVYDKFALVAKECNGRQQNIISKINDKWVVIYGGDGMIKCSLVNDFDIPRGIDQTCVENGRVYLNPNP